MAVRTGLFSLCLSPFEREALDRVVSAGGYASRAEALRYLIRREDPQALSVDVLEARRNPRKNVR